ncbi:cilia- and flagella-associated protein 251-like [Mytilus californianus]|uniref:cilia- and flagella-associated protein 251-like n=1 Tax=Mytilus californianus TaxID=6549 RepID=UPI002245166C|nr:cilia- and flagella-associated protein 251-like [Mytilus californianus]
MTCTKEEEDQFLLFQREREEKMIIEKVREKGVAEGQQEEISQKRTGFGFEKQRTVLGDLYPESNMFIGKVMEKKQETKKAQVKKRTPEKEREEEEKKRRKEEKGKEVEKENQKGKEETEKENKKESVQKQKDVLSILLKEMETSSVGSLEGVSLCDLGEDDFLEDIEGLTSAVEPISPLPADPCMTIPDIDIPAIDLPSSEPPLSSTSLCLPLSTQPCPTYSPTQEPLSPSDLRQAAATYTPTPVKKLKLEQIQKSQQSLFFYQYWWNQV